MSLVFPHMNESQLAKVGLRDAAGELTFAELETAVLSAASYLIDVGAGAGQRVAIFAENSKEVVIAHGAGMVAGSSTVPVNFHLTAPETRYILEHSGATVLFLGPENLERGLEAAEGLEIEIILWGARHDRTTPWEDTQRGGTVDLTSITPHPSLMYTSGTTGRPKGTQVPPTMFAGGANVVEHLERLRAGQMASFNTHLVVGPLYHTGPLGGVRHVMAGVSVTVLGRFDAERTLAAIEEHRIETSLLVPTHFVRLLALPEEVRNRYDLSSLQWVGQTGSKCPIDVKRRMIEWWGPVFWEAYGATEVGTTCIIGSEEWLEHPGSVGRCLEPFEALVVDDDGNPLGPGEEGRLYFRDTTGRGVIYEGDTAGSAAAHLAPGVFTLGEIGYVDVDGFVYITDRFSDMVVSGGVNIYPAEAENVLNRHPEVIDVACIGLPHDEMGEELVAVVSLRSPVEASELMSFCRDNLSHYKCPRRIIFSEDVGRNAMGKVNKKTLRERFVTA
jgi:long-chain acyl-CoA synthetase